MAAQSIPTSSVTPNSFSREKLSSLALEVSRLASASIYCLELGAGNGSVTRALAPIFLNRRLGVAEPSRSKAALIKKRAPTSRVFTAPIWEVIDVFSPRGSATIVSGLNFWSMHNKTRHMLIVSIADFLKGRTTTTFFHYGSMPVPPFKAPHGFLWAKVSTILASVPPKFIWQLVYIGKRNTVGGTLSEESYPSEIPV